MSDRELLSLIPVFDAIMSERSISRAATRLGVTQSAVSQALARLRKLTNDPLFEGHGRGVRPTPRAQEMAEHVRSALTHANAAFAPKTLDIAKSERTFILDIGGGFDALMLPGLYAELAKAAPNVRCLVSNGAGATCSTSSSMATLSWRSIFSRPIAKASAASAWAARGRSCWRAPAIRR